MGLKSDLPASMEAAALADLANEAVTRLLSLKYPSRQGTHASDLTDRQGSPHRKISARRMMLQGYYAEQKWVEIFREAGILVFPNGSRPPAHESGIEYTPDVVVRLEGAHKWKDDGWHSTDYIIEIKSVGSDVFQRVQKREGPFKKHWLRTRLYLLLSGVARGFILYESRDSLDIWLTPVGPLSDEDRSELDSYIRYKTNPFEDDDAVESDELSIR